MDTLYFSIVINASREKVWNVLWNDNTYRNWNSVFCEGSHAVSDWEQGSWIMFLTQEGNGMLSLIDKKIPNEMMSFRHIGALNELPENELSNQWLGTSENYTLKELNGKTELMVEMQVNEESREYFNARFPKALAQVRLLSEVYYYIPMGIH